MNTSGSDVPTVAEPVVDIVDVGGNRLNVARWGDATPRIVMLHDGLGSVSLWRDVPERIAERTGIGVVAYDRAGHGRSTPVPSGPWPVDWLHHEADVLAELLTKLGIDAPLLVGHSDGGSIALLHAASGHPCAGVVVLAAHSWVEECCVDAITAMREDPGQILAGLARHHAAPNAVFEAWSGVWTDGGFRSWDIRGDLGAISCPTLVVQGDSDEYATDAQLTETVAAIGANARPRRLTGIGHVIHRHASDTIVDLVDTFALDHLEGAEHARRV